MECGKAVINGVDVDNKRMLLIKNAVFSVTGDDMVPSDALKSGKLTVKEDGSEVFSIDVPSKTEGEPAITMPLIEFHGLKAVFVPGGMVPRVNIGIMYKKLY